MPAGFVADIEVFGETVLRRRLLRFADRAEDASSAFHAVARILRHATERNFATRGVYGGERWPDLDPAYAARTGRTPGEDILRLTDRLYDSLMDETDSEHIHEFGPESMRWGSRVPYGTLHQSRAPRTRLPFRPPLRLNERDKRAIVSELHRALIERGT